MAPISTEAIGLKLKEKRGEMGIREFAKSIGTSPATLSRIERGYLPDLETFRKICKFLEINPAAVLGLEPNQSPGLPFSVHFKKNGAALKPETASALAEMLLAAHRAMLARNEPVEHE